MKMETKGIKVIIQEQTKKQKEESIYNMLREKFELEREVRVGESAAIKIKELDKQINKYYVQLGNSSLR